MNTRTHSSPSSNSESGQAAAFMALLLFVVFLAFAALAIDGAMTYSVRRDLQNVADSAALAACRVIAGNDTSGGNTIETNALIAATNSISTHLGSSTSYYSPKMGTGTGLVRGIEISAKEVRVAVMRQVPTVLSQFLGRQASYYNAKAHCDSTAGGGLMPIAVPRYLTSKDKMTPPNPEHTDFLGRTGSPLYPADSITVTWTGRYGPFQVPVPCGNPGAPTCYDGLGNPVTYVAAESAVAGTPDASSGPQVAILGQSAQTNSGTANFRNFVLLDIRNVGPQDPIEYYNGVDTQANAAKNVSQQWIYQHGYPGPNPEVGSEVAILAGTSNNFSAKELIQDAGYQQGDLIPTIVYDGYVWKRPDFSLSLNPVSGNGITAGCGSSCPTGSAPIAYTVKIAQAGSTAWGTSPAFTLYFNFNNEPLPPGSQVRITSLTPVAGTPTDLSGPDYSYSILTVGQTGWTGQLQIWNTEALTRTPFLTGINAYATSSLNTHGLNTDGSNPSTNVQFGFWSGGNVPISYTARSDAGTLTVTPGGQIDANLVVYGVGTGFPPPDKKGNPTPCKNVPVVGSVFGNGASWGTIFSSNASVGNIDITNGSEATLSPKLTVQNLAPVASGYTLRYTIGPATCNGGGGGYIPQSIVDIPLRVITNPITNATPDSFVIIQGYALFRVSGWDANDVYGYAVSGLYPSLDDVTVGLRARLVPW